MDINARYQTFEPDNEVPSAFLNNLQDRDLDIVAKAADGVAAFLSLCGTAADKVITYYFFDSGHSGTYSEDGVGELARIALTGGKTVDYEYDANADLVKITLTHGAEVREFTIGYNANGDVGSITIHQPE